MFLLVCTRAVADERPYLFFPLYSLKSASGVEILAHLLHMFADLDVSFEIFGNASIQTVGFILIQIPLAIGRRDTFLMTVIYQFVEHIGNKVQFGLSGLDFLLRGKLWLSATTET